MHAESTSGDPEGGLPAGRQAGTQAGSKNLFHLLFVRTNLLPNSNIGFVILSFVEQNENSHGFVDQIC